MNLQEQDLNEYLGALNLDADHDKPHADSDQLNQLIVKPIENFEDYICERASLARENATTSFAPHWCMLFECSMM